MLKKKYILSIVIILVLLFYVIYEFYKIEHIKTEQETYLITQSSDLYTLLESYKEDFKQVVEYVHNDIDKHDYYLLDEEYDNIPSVGDNFQSIKNNCNIIFIRANQNRSCIEFFQTLGHNNEYKYVNLCIRCNVNDTGELIWDVQKVTSSDMDRKEDFAVKLYNIIYN